jgi:hypothetical protein
MPEIAVFSAQEKYSVAGNAHGDCTHCFVPPHMRYAIQNHHLNDFSGG